MAQVHSSPQLQTLADPLPSGTMRTPLTEHGRQVRRSMHGGMSSPAICRCACVQTALVTAWLVMAQRTTLLKSAALLDRPAHDAGERTPQPAGTA